MLALRAFGRGEFEPRGIIRGLLLLQGEVRHIARLVLALGEIDGGLLDIRDGVLMGEHGLVALKFIDGHFHVGHEPERGVGHAELRGGELIGGHALAEREHQEIEQIEGGGFLPIRAGGRSIGKAHAQIEAGVFPEPRLAQIGGGYAHVLEGGEQFTIVEQRDLHGAVYGQRFFQQGAHVGQRRLACGGVLLPAHVKAGAVLHRFFDGMGWRFPRRGGERGEYG